MSNDPRTIEFGTTVEIRASAARVWEVLRDVERWPEWTPTVTSIERLDPGSLTVGSRARIRQPRLPATVWRVTRLDEGRGFVWAAEGPGVRLVAHHWVEPTAAGSLATLSLRFTGPLGGLVARLTRRLTERYLALEARGLRARCEGVDPQAVADPPHDSA